MISGSSVNKVLRALKEDCYRKLLILKYVSHTKCGVDRETILKLCKAVALPKLLYACEVYRSAINGNLKKLKPGHNTALRITTGAFRISPISSLLVEILPTVFVWLRNPHPLLAFALLHISPPIIVCFACVSFYIPVLSSIPCTPRFAPQFPSQKNLLSMPAPGPSSNVFPHIPLPFPLMYFLFFPLPFPLHASLYFELYLFCVF